MTAAGAAGASNTLPTQGLAHLAAPGAGKLAVQVPSGGSVAEKTASYSSNGASATVTLPQSPRTLINWTTFGVGPADSLAFVFTNSANDVVVNRVPLGASILIDHGGAVSGSFKGATGGSIWFVASGGVFIKGAVTANGVLATTNPAGAAGLSNLDLLNDSPGALKAHLAGLAALIDLSGTVSASGVELDAKTGNIILTGAIDTGPSGTADLRTLGVIAADTATITAGTLTGVSAGGASFDNPANTIASFGPFIDVADGDVTLADRLALAVTGRVDVGAGTLSLRTVNGAPLLLAADLTAAGGDVRLASSGAITQTAGVITASTLTGSSEGGATLADANLVGRLAGFVNLDAGAITLRNAADLAVTGTVDNAQGVGGAGRDILVNLSQGSMTGTGVFIARGDVALQSAGGSLSFASASAGNDIVLLAPAGAVNLDGSLTAGGAGGRGLGQAVFRNVGGALDGLFTLGPESIFIGAAAYTNNGYGSASPATLTAAGAIGLALADPDGVTLADARPGSAGSWIVASTLSAPTVSLFESKGNIGVGGGRMSPAATTLNLYTGGVITVTGPFAPASDNTNDLTMGDPAQASWTPSRIEVINDGGTTGNAGSIGLATTTFSTVSLYAKQDILLGAQGFITANAAVATLAQLEQIDPYQPVPAVQANLSKAVMLAAGDITLAAGRLIVQQNTTGLRTHDGAGLYVTGDLTLGAYTPFPPAIDLFGVFVPSGARRPITGPLAALGPQIAFIGDLEFSPDRGLYRINGCVIGDPTSCAPVDVARLFLDRHASASEQFMPPCRKRNLIPDCESEDLLAFGEQDIEDPTIMGAPNEEIWRSRAVP